MRSGTPEEAIAALFVRELGWVPGEGADVVALTGALTLVILADSDAVPGVRQIGAVLDPDGRTMTLLALTDGTVTRLDIDREHPKTMILERLCLLRREQGVREQDKGKDDRRLAECFQVEGIADSFLADYRSLFEKYVDRVEPMPATRSRSTAQQDSQALNGQLLNRCLIRVLLLAFLQGKGWFRISDSQNYIAELYRAWKAAPGAYRFHQRLAILFFNALNQPSAAAREMLRPQVGDVPHLGGGIFSPEQFESESAVIPDELFDELVGENGLLGKYEFSTKESGPDESVVAVNPEVLGAVFSAFIQGDDKAVIVDTKSLREGCRGVIAQHMDTTTALDLPTERKRLKEWMVRARAINIVDEECGSGSYLVAMLEEITALIERISRQLGNRPLRRSALKAQIAKDNLRGLDKSELAVQVTMMRLALAILSEESEAVPLVLPDLRRVVRVGGALKPVRAASLLPVPPEGAEVEYKSTFEWNSRKGARDSSLRLATLKTVAAFLNSEGGKLYLGISDEGEPIGLVGDFSLFSNGGSRDRFEGKLREALKNHMEPLPLGNVRIEWQLFGDVDVCIVCVSQSLTVTYVRSKDDHGQQVESIYVRDGNRTLDLKGKRRDQFVISRRS